MKKKTEDITIMLYYNQYQNLAYGLVSIDD